jgi:hypothetical protein
MSEIRTNTVSRIRAILIQIRIDILGSIHWITDPDFALLASGFEDANKKISFFSQVFQFFTECRCIHISFQRKQANKKSQTVESEVFPHILLVVRRLWIRIWSPIRTSNYASGIKVARIVYISPYSI